MSLGTEPPLGEVPGPRGSGLCMIQGVGENKRDTQQLQRPLYPPLHPPLASVAQHASRGSVGRAKRAVLRHPAVPRPTAGAPGPRRCGPGGELLRGAARLPPPARLTSCPWRRCAGTRPPEPRKTASCPAGIRSGEGGRRRARSRRVSLAGSRPGLNAPRPGPPRLGGQTPGAPAPLHLQALGVGPGANRPANVRHLHVLGLGLPARHRRPSQLLGAPPALHFLPLPAWVPKAASADESARGDLPSAPQLVPAAPFCPSRSGS